MLSADKRFKHREGVAIGVPLAADAKPYLGSLVCFNLAGYGVPGAAVAGYKAAGVAFEAQDNTGGSDGDKTVVVHRKIEVLFKGVSLSQADVGKDVFVVDDETVSRTAAGVAVTDEVLVADAGGSLAIFEGFLANQAVLPGSVSIAATVSAAGVAMADDGNGRLTGTGGDGIVDYESGYYRLIFNTAPDDDTAINASYRHGAVRVGTLREFLSATAGYVALD